MSGYYASNPHHAPADYSDRLELIEHCEAAAGYWFAYATKPQKAAYDQAMADLRGLQGPRYERARDAANAVWRDTTTAARELYDETTHLLVASGSSEVPEELSYRWEELTVSSAMREAAE